MENKKLWFKAKKYGYGWYPCSWEGWGVILLYTISLVFHLKNVDKFATGASDVLINFMIPFLINTAFLIIISYAKGEPAKWRWGDK